MIISPRAKKVTNVLRKDGNGFIKIRDVFLYRRTDASSPYRKVLYWTRTEDSAEPPPQKFSSFAIVPEMTAAVTKGYAVYGSAATAWKSFDRSVLTSNTFDIVSFPELRYVKGFALQFENASGNVSMAVEGKIHGGQWIRLFESSAALVNGGRYAALTTPMFCNAVRLLTNSTSAVRSCQFFEAVPLVPITMTFNTSGGVKLISEPANVNLYRCFTEQSNAFSHGTADWYAAGMSNVGRVSTKEQRRFWIEFSEPKTVCGFSVGGITNFYAGYCYANCLLIEGRESENDFWQPLGEVQFNPAERRTRFFDFAKNRTVKELRITVQDITHPASLSENISVYLPPMQVWGEE
jgi:hypothetical protein